MKKMKEEMQIKKKIGVGFVIIVEVRDMEENIREVTTKRIREVVVDCYWDVVVKKKVIAKYKGGILEKRLLFVFVCMF